MSAEEELKDKSWWDEEMESGRRRTETQFMKELSGPYYSELVGCGDGACDASVKFCQA